MATQPLIFNAAAECRKSFTKCQTVDLLMENEWAENRLADFNLWASGIGASVRSRASLDARLALKVDAQNIVAGLLWTLNAEIEQCIMHVQEDKPQSEVISLERVGETEEEDGHRGRSDTTSPPDPSPRDFSPWSDDTSSDSQPYEVPRPTTNSRISENMRDVEKMLDQLSRIAITIRQSGTSSRLQKADKTLNIDDHKDLRSHLITVILSQKQLHGVNSFSPEQVDPLTCGLTAVQFRLIDCNLKRRNRFLYAQRHSTALDTQSSGDKLSEKKIHQQSESRHHPQQEHPMTTVSNPAKPTEQHHDVSVKTGTSASRVTDQFLLPQNLVPSQASTTQLSTTVIKLDYPHLPKMNREMLLFKCPCCCQTLPASMREKHRWIKHLSEDLCPYTCILPDCSKPDILYIAKEDWIKHLDEDHRSTKYWLCFACLDAPRFNEEHSFEQHIWEVHHDTISEDQTPIFVSSCEQSVPAEVDSCPLCTWSTADGEEKDRRALIDHIAKEVHAFSLRSLPWNDDNGQESEEQRDQSSEKVSKWLEINEPYKRPSIERPPLDKDIHAAGYFQNNLYFADTLTSSNSSENGSYNSREKELEELINIQGLNIFGSTAGEDESLHRESPSRPLLRIPFSCDPDFVSRGDILDQIAVRCLEPAGRVALLGLGGVGKSQLAIEFAHKFAEEYSNVWVFWIHAATQAHVEEGFRMIADAIELPERGQSKADIPLLVKNWLSIEHNGKWIIILDGADDSEVLYSADESGYGKQPLVTYIPKSRNGSVVLTTRNRNLASKLTGGYKHIINVDTMTETDALTLLEKKMGSPLSRWEASLAEDLVKALECIPLAIIQAAAYIQTRKPRSSIEKYLFEFHKSERESMRPLKYEANEMRGHEETSNTVLRTWTISFENIRLHQGSAADLLSLMSFFDRQGIPRWVLSDSTMQSNSRDGSDVSEPEAGDKPDNNLISSFEEDILVLRNYCLIDVNERGDMFEMHRLVQLSIKSWLKASGLQETFMQRYITVMAASFPTGGYENWEICRDLFAHVQVAIDYQPNESTLEDWVTLCYKGGYYARLQGRYDIAEQMVDKVKRVCEKNLGGDDNSTLRSILLLASIISDKGRWEEAEKLQVRVMETRKTKFGAEHPETLESMSLLAFTYSNQGRWDEAENLQMQVLGLQKTQFGADHPETLISISNLASIYGVQGRWEEAEKLEVLVMKTRKTILGADHPETLESMSKLASTYWSQNRLNEAEKLQMQVLETRKTALGADHPDTLISISNLALIYADQGQWEEAEKLQVRVMETRKAILGADHPDTLESMKYLAVTWKDQGRHENALVLMKDCLQGLQRVLGPQHPETLESLVAVERWSNNSD